MPRLFQHENDFILVTAAFEMAAATSALALISEGEQALVVERRIRERGEQTTPEHLREQIRQDIYDAKRQEDLREAKQGEPGARKRAILMASMNIACMIRRNLANYGCDELYERTRTEIFDHHAPRMTAKLLRVCDPGLFAAVAGDGDKAGDFLAWAGEWVAGFMLSVEGREALEVFRRHVENSGEHFAYEGHDEVDLRNLEDRFLASGAELACVLLAASAVVRTFQLGLEAAVAEMFGARRAKEICRPDEGGLDLRVLNPEKLFNEMLSSRLSEVFLRAKHSNQTKKKEAYYLIDIDCEKLLGEGGAVQGSKDNPLSRVLEMRRNQELARKVAVQACRYLRRSLLSLPGSQQPRPMADVLPTTDMVRQWVGEYVNIRFQNELLERRRIFCGACKKGYHQNIADEKILSMEADGRFIEADKPSPAAKLSLSFNLSLMAYYFFNVPDDTPRSGPAKKKLLADAEYQVFGFLAFILAPENVFFSLPMFLGVLGQISLNAIYNRKLPKAHAAETDEELQSRLLKKFVIFHYLMPESTELARFKPDTRTVLLQETYRLLQRMPFESLLKLKAVRDKSPGFYASKLLVMLKESGIAVNGANGKA